MDDFNHKSQKLVQKISMDISYNAIFMENK